MNKAENNRVSFRIPSLVATTLVLALLTLPAWSSTEEQKSFSTDHLTVRNLIGKIQVEGHRGSDFEVIVRGEGRDAAEGAIQLDSAGDELNIRFTTGDGDFVYPALGRGNTNLKLDNDSGLSRLFDGRRVRVSGSGQGTELWADVTIRVPSGGRLEVEHGVGAIQATGVDGEIQMGTRSGNVELDDLDGRVAVATGSGEVAARRVRGERIEIATGSGAVTGEDCRGDRLSIATGSGTIMLARIDGRSVEVATGSGDVSAKEMLARGVEIATGSGDVHVSVDQLSDGELQIATGSGDVELFLPAGASAELHAETDRGKVHVDLADAIDYRVREDEEVKLTIGAGAARVQIGSGSGDIRISN